MKQRAARIVLRIGAALAILAAPGFAYAQSFSWGHILATFPKGSGSTSIGIIEPAAEAPALGPAAIATTTAGAPLILDTVNRRIVRVVDAKTLVYVAGLERLGYASDMIRLGNRLLVWDGTPHYSGTFLLDSDTFRMDPKAESSAEDDVGESMFASHGAVKPERPHLNPGSPESTGRLNSRLSARQTTGATLLSADGTRFEYVIDMLSSNQAEVRLSSPARGSSTLMLSIGTRGELGTVVPIAIDLADRSYFRVEELPEPRDHSRVKVWIYRFSAEGLPDGGYDVPDELLEIVPNRYLAVSDQGAVYFLISRMTETSVARLRPMNLMDFEGYMERRVFEIVEEMRKGPSRRPRSAPESTSERVQPLSRNVIVETAEKFRTLRWKLGDANYGGERVSRCAPENGMRWLRPASLEGKAGQFVEGVPYNWGGFMSTEQFSKRIDSNAVAGNVCTCRTRDCVDPAAAGVDCSGFVSQAWGVGRKTTATLFEVAERVGSYDDLVTGDMLNKPNSHVRLFISPSPVGNGSIRAYESSVLCGGVCIRDFSRKQLEGYVGGRRRNLKP